MVRHRGRQLKRTVVALAALALATYVGWFCYTRITYRPDPRTAYWAAKLREINPPTPDMMPFDEVVAIFEKATDRSWAPKSESDRIEYENIVRSRWDPDANLDIAGAIKAFEESAFQDEYADFRETVRRGWAEPAESILASENYDYRFDLRSWVTVLLAYSRYLGESRHDVVARSEVWRELAISARQMEQSRYFFTILTCSDNRINIGNEITLAVQETDAGTRIPLPTELLVTDAERAARPADRVAGIAARHRHLIDSLFVADGGWADVSSAAELLYVRRPVPRIWNLASPIYYDRDEAEAALSSFLAELDGFTNAGTLRQAYGPTLRSLPPANPLLLFSRGDPLPLRYVESLDWMYAGQTAVEAAACSIALHNYRVDHGEYPQSLDLLLPDHLPRLPMDFGDGKPLRYRRTGEGYVLYSVGGDGVDDSGGVFQPMIERSNRTWQSSGADFPCSDFQRAAAK